MILKTSLLLVLSLPLFCSTFLQSNYSIKTDDINLSSIIPHAKPDVQLFRIEGGKYTKRVKSNQLLGLLKEYGYNNFLSKSSYIKFTKQSPVDNSKVQKMLKDYYEKKYLHIDIQQMNLTPRGYITSLPEQFTINFQSKSHLSNMGTLFIKDKQNKKIFFDYEILANVDVYIASKNMKRGEELSFINSTKKSIILQKFIAMPLQELEESAKQTKKQFKKGDIITLRDIQTLSIVKRGSAINVNLNSADMAISFTAKALQDGKMGDMIDVQKSNNKKLKVLVTGKNTAEIR
jgi:flagella basal body P-ring formation protein FlgA